MNRFRCWAAACVLSVSACAEAQGNDHAIHLQSRSFEPDAGVQAERIAHRHRHLILQFRNAIEPAAIKAMEARQIALLGPVPRNAVLVSVPSGAAIDGLPGLRWAGRLLPSDKIERRVAADAGRHGYIVVDFHLDIDADLARDAARELGAIVHERAAFPDTTLLLRIPDLSAVEALAQRDEVAFIYAASSRMIRGNNLTHCPGPLTPLGRVQNFVAGDDGWDGPGLGSASIAYHFTNTTDNLDPTEAKAIVTAGIEEWSRVVDLDFSSTGIQDATDSIQILFGVGDHSDTSGIAGDPPFDGPFGVLAHAFFPSNPETVRGDIHFDDGENWNQSLYFDLFSVALHEAGHSIGLDHSFDPDAVMWPSASVFSRLHPDDIAGAQSIYAVPGGLNLYTPRGGESLAAGKLERILWVDGTGAGSTVTITLYKDGVLQGPIAVSTPNDGAYDWRIPDELHTSSGYTIEIVSDSIAQVRAESLATFTINRVERTSYFPTDLPDQIKNNGEGQNFGAFSFVTVRDSEPMVDVEIANIGIDFEDIGDLEYFFLSPASSDFNFFQNSGNCQGSAAESIVPFDFDDDAALGYGDDCPPVAGAAYRPAIRLASFIPGIDPNGTWNFGVVDANATDPAGPDGSLESWHLIIGTAAPAPGPFSPVYLDLDGESPGAGTSNRPYTLLEPARASVSASGEIRIAAGTYALGPLTIDQAVTLTVDPKRPGTARFE